MIGPVPPRRRFQISVALGLLAGLRAYLNGVLDPLPRDFAQVWYAARAVLSGYDPYAMIGPGRAFEWNWPLFYPLPAALAVTPLAPLPAVWASTIFMCLGGGCFAWALMEHGYAPLLGFMSAAMVLAAEVVQWSPLYAAALILPPLGIVFVAKPTIGAALWFARPSRWAIVGGVLLVGGSFLIQPDWFAAWRSGFDPSRVAVASGLHFGAPVMQPGGFVALFALARWRRPEARLIAALACVPQSLVVYETVPLFLVPRTLTESIVLVALSYVAQMGIVVTMGRTLSGHGNWWITCLLYLPATLMVLRRPNVGTAPAWVTRLLPTQLRGADA